jgi:hypothetical protein
MSAPQPSSTNSAIARVIALGQERDAIELRYEIARAGRLVSVVPDSIDLRLYPETKREPAVPRLVTAGEMKLSKKR